MTDDRNVPVQPTYPFDEAARPSFLLAEATTGSDGLPAHHRQRARDAVETSPTRTTDILAMQALFPVTVAGGADPGPGRQSGHPAQRGDPEDPAAPPGPTPPRKSQNLTRVVRRFGQRQ